MNNEVVTVTFRGNLVPAGTGRTGKYVAALVASFKIGDVLSDGPAFTKAMIAELSEYPPGILDQAIRKARRTIKWLPSIAEMVEICDALVGEQRQLAHQAEAAARDEAARLQYERDMAQRPKLPPITRRQEPFVGEIPF